MTSAAALLCLVGGSAATPPRALAARTAADVVPRAALYTIRISGQTSYGSFVRNGALLVTPRIRAAGGVNFANGPNAREVGLFSGRPPSSPEQGAIWFATNTAIFQRVGIGNVNQGLAALDVAYVTAGPSSLRVRIDGDFYGLPAARTALLNCMNASSGLLANVYQLIGGTMVVVFRGPRGSRVSGAVSFVGNGYIEPASSPYRATFVGRRIR